MPLCRSCFRSAAASQETAFERPSTRSGGEFRSSSTRFRAALRLSTGRCRTSGTYGTRTSPVTVAGWSTSSESNLHLVSYSEPFRGDAFASRAAAASPLAAGSPGPDSVPHVVLHADLGLLHGARAARRGSKTQSTRSSSTAHSGPGSLTYGECFLPGEREDEVLLTTHVCHPSLANDNLSGIAVLTELGGAAQRGSRAPSLTVCCSSPERSARSRGWRETSNASIGSSPASSSRASEIPLH